MTALELLEKFVRRKFRDNYRLDEIKGLSTADIVELRLWPEREAREVLKELRAHYCPWCLLVRQIRKGSCAECDYGYRHGICRDVDSDHWFLSRWRQNNGIHADKDGTTEDLKKILEMRNDVCN